MSFLVDDDVAARVARLDVPFNAHGYDRYGTSRAHLEVFFSIVAKLYRSYFTVEATGLEHIPGHGRAMIVGNHSGGYAIDGLMTVAACFLELEPPRLAQGMAEKFISALPVSALWSQKLGQLPGLPENAERLLNDDRLLMVFPEGARGTAKLYKDRWSLVDFGTGFVRLALKTKTPIIPMAFVGGGDVVPTVTNLYKLGRVLGVPYIPVTPWGLALPLPRACGVHFGAPLIFEGDGNEDDEAIGRCVAEVKASIAGLLADARPAHERRVRPLPSFIGGGG
jgi:1-acyl-sn-glycerol-3-phosphate acyltransferase